MVYAELAAAFALGLAELSTGGNVVAIGGVGERRDEGEEEGRDELEWLHIGCVCLLWAIV